MVVREKDTSKYLARTHTEKKTHTHTSIHAICSLSDF